MKTHFDSLHDVNNKSPGLTEKLQNAKNMKKTHTFTINFKRNTFSLISIHIYISTPSSSFRLFLSHSRHTYAMSISDIGFSPFHSGKTFLLHRIHLLIRTHTIFSFVTGL